ncbi:interleukin-12 subunit beta isoform X2 [Myripristis murdjan]|uniref:interleukin-12 subunit beta isoform X2 n=1 Tax=Myripristis murdjan TaxID=586833 RepID=UPI0011761B63|nr:interleukin-12 subunit beta-like isoform X2 [Myripristis murdjan]
MSPQVQSGQMTLSLWIFGLLLISLPGAHGFNLNSFPENFVVAKKDHQATLTCDVKSDESIKWKFNNESLDDDEANGRSLTVSEVEEALVGEYSCWRGGEQLSSVYLLLDTEGDVSDSPLTCRAQSYHCNFSCKWTSEHKVVRLGLGHNCSVDEKSCHWVKPNLPLEGGFQFELYHSLSPYAEESTMLTVTAEAIDEDYSFLRLTERFYLREIIQPDSPTIVNCQKVGHHLNVTIEPPSSWSTPYSFFNLEHQIEYVHRDDGAIESTSSTLIPWKISSLRVRSRDALVLSEWSQWTPWKNVHAGKKKLCKCKNTVKYCCPQLSPEDLLHCKKKKKKNKKLRTN